MCDRSIRIESWPRNSLASITAPSHVARSFFTSGCADASVGFGPSSFFFTGAFGAPGAAGAAFCAASFAAATRAFASSIIASFSESADGGEEEFASRAWSVALSLLGPASADAGLSSSAINAQLTPRTKTLWLAGHGRAHVTLTALMQKIQKGQTNDL